jgi:hypothetical protein
MLAKIRGKRQDRLVYLVSKYQAAGIVEAYRRARSSLSRCVIFGISIMRID